MFHFYPVNIYILYFPSNNMRFNYLDIIRKSKRSQSALEYMMTYGWAILIIVIVAVILYSMGIFNPSSSVTFTSSGFSPFKVSSSLCTSLGLDLSIIAGPIPNDASSLVINKLFITSATGTNTTTIGYSLPYPISLTSGKSADILIPSISCTSSGTKYSLLTNLQYSYTTAAGNIITNTTGTIAGTSSKPIPTIFSVFGLPTGSDFTVSYMGINKTTTYDSNISFESVPVNTFRIYPVLYGGVTYYPIYSSGSNLPVNYNLEVDFIPMRNLWFTNYDANNVSMIYYNNNTLALNEISGETGFVSVGTNPNSIAITPNGQYAYVTDRGSNSISVISVSSDSVISTIPVGIVPMSIAITPNGQYAYVTDLGSNHIQVISTASNSVVATISVGTGVDGIAITPNGQYAYAADESTNSTLVISTASNSVVATIPVGSNPRSYPRGIAITPNGKYAYVTDQGSNSISVISTSSNSVVATIPVGLSPTDVAITPNGQYAYVTNEESNSTSVISTSSNSVITTISVGNNPWGVAITPNGKYAYVTDQGSNSISVISISSNSVVTTITGTPLSPCGINYGPLGDVC